MRKLGQTLAERPDVEPLWRARAGWRTVGAVRSAVATLASQIASPRIALAFGDDESLAIGLLAAESRCEVALLVPASWDQAAVDRYLPRTGIDVLVTDRTDLVYRTVVRPTSLAADMPDRAVTAATGHGMRWIIPTSGTTGEPKLVEHEFTSLARTVKTDSRKGRELTWGLLYELARFAGLQVFLQAVLGGSKLAFVNRAAGIEALIAELSATGCNALSATPTLWRRLMMAPAAEQLPLRLITLGGEIADQAILTLLTLRYPSAKLVHIYASTEAGVGFSVTDGKAGFPAEFLELSPGGVQLKVGPEGDLWVRPVGAAQRFVGAEIELVGQDGWINSGDRVKREGDRYHFLGRANGSINVGGNKVFPEEVEDCIRSVAGVLLVSVRARSNPITGSLVEARVKSAPAFDRGLLKDQIVKSCRASLAPYKVPALVTWVDDIAVTSAGKVARS
jgi:acyl-CoA synthetase (AMP-forming)/AMP-acid ligase II